MFCGIGCGTQDLLNHFLRNSPLAIKEKKRLVKTTILEVGTQSSLFEGSFGIS